MNAHALADRRRRRCGRGDGDTTLPLWLWRTALIISALTTCHNTRAILVNGARDDHNASSTADAHATAAVARPLLRQPQASQLQLLSDQHWALIRWYFERVPVIELTQLRSGDATRRSEQRTEFHTELNVQLSKGTRRRLKMYIRRTNSNITRARISVDL